MLQMWSYLAKSFPKYCFIHHKNSGAHNLKCLYDLSTSHLKKSSTPHFWPLKSLNGCICAHTLARTMILVSIPRFLGVTNPNISLLIFYFNAFTNKFKLATNMCGQAQNMLYLCTSFNEGNYLIVYNIFLWFKNPGI